MEPKRRYGVYKTGNKAGRIIKAKDQIPQLTRTKPKIEKNLSNKTPSADLVRKIHLEYLNIMQRHYADQYENMSKKFYEKFGQHGEKAKTPQQRSTFDRFHSERNGLFQAGLHKRLHQLIDRINDERGRDELYTLTDQHQQGMKKTLQNLRSML